MATHSNILAWRIPWKRSLAGYSPQGLKESDRTEHAYTHTHTQSPYMKEMKEHEDTGAKFFSNKVIKKIILYGSESLCAD